jgi:hypothetical protein
MKYRSQAENVKRLPKLEPSEYDISKSIHDGHEENYRPGWERAMRPNIQELKRLVSTLEDRGSNVLFF